MRLVELQSEPYKATSQSIIELVNFLGSVVFCYKGQVYYIFFFRYLVVIIPRQGPKSVGNLRPPFLKFLLNSVFIAFLTKNFWLECTLAVLWHFSRPMAL